MRIFECPFGTRAYSAGSTCQKGQRTLPSRVVLEPFRDESHATSGYPNPAGLELRAILAQAA